MEKLVDASFLEKTGAACLLHSLTETMLEMRPENPVQWLRAQVESKNFYLTPKHLRALIPSLADMNQELVLDCLIDGAPPTFPSSGGAEEEEQEEEESFFSIYGRNDGIDFDIQTQDEYSLVMEELGEGLAVSWTREELHAAYDTLGQKLEAAAAVDSRATTTPKKKNRHGEIFAISWTLAVFELAITRMEGQAFVDDSYAAGYKRASAEREAEEAAAAEESSKKDGSKKSVAPSQLDHGGDQQLQQQGGEEVGQQRDPTSSAPPPIEVPSLHTHLDVVLPFTTTDVQDLESMLLRLSHHLTWGLVPLKAGRVVRGGGSTRSSSAPLPSSDYTHTSASFVIHLLHQLPVVAATTTSSSPSSSSSSPLGIPRDIDVVNALVHRAGLDSCVQVHTSTLLVPPPSTSSSVSSFAPTFNQHARARLLSQLQQDRKYRAQSSSIKQKECTVFVEGPIPCQHGASLVRLALPIFGSTDTHTSTLQAVTENGGVVASLPAATTGSPAGKKSDGSSKKGGDGEDAVSSKKGKKGNKSGDSGEGKTGGGPAVSLNIAAIETGIASGSSRSHVDGHTLVSVSAQCWASTSPSTRLSYVLTRAGGFPPGASGFSAPLLQVLNSTSTSSIAVKSELLAAASTDMINTTTVPSDTFHSFLLVLTKLKQLGIFPHQGLSTTTTTSFTPKSATTITSSPATKLKSALGLITAEGLNALISGSGGGGGAGGGGISAAVSPKSPAASGKSPTASTGGSHVVSPSKTPTKSENGPPSVATPVEGIQPTVQKILDALLPTGRGEGMNTEGDSEDQKWSALVAKYKAPLMKMKSPDDPFVF